VAAINARVGIVLIEKLLLSLPADNKHNRAREGTPGS
jgi:hypothetical protein